MVLDIGKLVNDVISGIAETPAAIAKNYALGQMETELKTASVEWIQKWERGEVSLADRYVISPYGEQLRLWKPAIQIINSTSSQEILQRAMKARPELSYIWNSQEAINRMDGELRIIREYLSRL